LEIDLLVDITKVAEYFNSLKDLQQKLPKNFDIKRTVNNFKERINNSDKISDSDCSNMIIVNSILSLLENNQNTHQIYDFHQNESGKLDITILKSIGFLVKNLIDEGLISIKLCKSNIAKSLTGMIEKDDMLSIQVADKGRKFYDKFRDVYPRISTPMIS
jgi:hypothetical protein